MKLFAKIFAVVMVILCLSLSSFGYLLISAAFRDSVRGEINQALNQYQMMKYILESQVSLKGKEVLSEVRFYTELAQTSQELSGTSNNVAVFSENQETIYSDFPQGYSLSLMGDVKENELVYRSITKEDGVILAVAGRFRCEDELLYFMIGRDIRYIIEQREQMEGRFGLIYCGVCLVAAVVTAVFAIILVLPIKKMTKSAVEIAEGNFAVRVSNAPKDELGVLASSFNQMAEAVENSMEELRQAAVSREDFVANFAHELKTPLTSVIGYADMICSRKLSQEDIQKAAYYIRDEGQRLEDLSLKLMELIVLDRQTFLLEELAAREVLFNAAEGITPILKEKQVRIGVQAEEAYISVEFDLFKTLLLNLLDNAVKADANDIVLTGKKDGGQYIITVEDNGRGIPKKELPRITEEFYMVDKSRSRKQHGAGLGLALAARIVKIHGAKLIFESEVGVGTKAVITLPCAQLEGEL